MIAQCDAKGLEIYCGAYLSQDAVMIDELTKGLDIHGINQKVLGLPEGDFGRLIAKIFIFRLMYGGTAYAYANDSDFASVSSSEKFWQKCIDDFYGKYKGFSKWHSKLLEEVGRTKTLIMPTGRQYTFEFKKNYKGESVIPQTTVKNYPVQGLGADIMSIARVSFRRRFIEAGIKGVIINTVHDSIVVDVEDSEISKVSAIFHGVFADLPANFKKVFGVEFNLPLRCEVKYGPNQYDMVETP